MPRTELKRRNMPRSALRRQPRKPDIMVAMVDTLHDSVRFKPPGATTYQRPSTLSIYTSEGLVKTLPADVLIASGSRIWENEIAFPENLENAVWSKVSMDITPGALDPEGGFTAFTLTAPTSATAEFEQTYPNSVVGGTILTSWYIRRRTGTGLIFGMIGSGNTIKNVTPFVTDQWQRIAFDPGVNTTGADKVGFLLTTQGDEIDVWHPMGQDRTSHANINTPDDYIAGGVGFSNRANGNTKTVGAGGVVTEGRGLLLRPQVVKSIKTDKGVARAKMYAKYKPRQDSFTQIVGDKMILAVDTVIPSSQTGNGHYYEVTTAGITAATAPDFTGALVIGDTVVDGGVTWANRGRYIIAGWLGEDAGANEFPFSFDLTQWAGDSTQTLDSVGIGGLPNTATTVSDASGGTVRVINIFTFPDNTDTHSITFIVGKDNTESRFPEFQMRFGGGSQRMWLLTQLNTKTGAITNRIADAGGSSEVFDYGGFWVVHLKGINNASGHTRADISIFPAVTNVWGGVTTATQGSIVVAHVHARVNQSFIDSPIITNGVALTRASSNLWPQYPINNHDDDRGTYVIDIVNGEGVTGTKSFIAVGSGLTGPLVQSPSDFSVSDGTGSAAQAYTADSENKQIVGAWSKIQNELGIHISSLTDKAGSISPYDDSFNDTTPICLRGGLQTQPTYTLNFWYIKAFTDDAARTDFVGFD